MLLITEKTPCKRGLFYLTPSIASLPSEIFSRRLSVDALHIIYIWAQAHTTVLLIGFFLSGLGVFFSKGKPRNEQKIRRWG